MEPLPFHIFLVEDNELYLIAMEKYLMDNLQDNTIIHTFSNGEDCLNNLELKPKIIILDYYLNSKDGLNGLEVLKKIKFTEPETAVIILSIQDNIKVAINTMKNGAYDYIAKGELTFFDLLNDINNIILEKRHHEKFRKVRKTRTIIWVALILITGIITFMIIFYFDWIRLFFS